MSVMIKTKKRSSFAGQYLSPKTESVGQAALLAASEQEPDRINQ